MRKNKTAFLSVVLAAALLVGPAQAAEGDIRISSYKGSTLPVGERSGLIIGPSQEAAQTVTSSNPEVVSVENVMGFWVAVTHAQGTATVTATGKAGETASITFTVGNEKSTPSKPVPDTPPDSNVIDLNANMEIRQEMIRLINQVRREHGVSELIVNEALMNATQNISTHRFTGHTPYEWEALDAYGWPHGGFNNLTCFNQASSCDVAQRAVENWVNSLYHFQAMLCEEGTCLGVGVTVVNDFAYCHMFVGIPNSYGPL